MKSPVLNLSVVLLYLLISCGTEPLKSTSKETTNDKNKVCVTAGFKDITEVSATLSGYANLTSDMTGDIKMGIVCSTSSTPDLKNSIMKTTRELNSDNQFSITVTGLQCGTKHYYRAFVYRNDVYTYGEIRSFETLEIKASVTTGSVSGITENSATITGSISFTPKANLSAKKGFYVSSTNSSKPEKWYSANSNFSTQLTNLEYGKTYYYMAAAIIDDLLFTGEVKSFSTETIEVSVSTGEIKNVSEHKATVQGTIKKTKPYDRLTQEAFLIYSSKNNTLEDLKKSSSYNIRKPLQPNGNGEISLDLEDLTQSTQYWCVIGYSIGGFEFWGDVKSFRTTKITVSFSDLRISDINELSAKFNGTVSYSVIEDLPISASLCYSQYKPSQDQSRSFGQMINLNGLPSNGRISHTIETLEPSTKYYCALYVQIGESSFCSEVVDFTTPTISASISVLNVTTHSFYDIIATGNMTYSTVCSLTELGFSLIGELDSGVVSYDNNNNTNYKSAFFDTTIESDGSFRASIPVCSPNESHRIRFIATIHGEKFLSDWYSFTPPSQNVYSTIRISSDTYRSGINKDGERYYYDRLCCNNEWVEPSHKNPMDGDILTITIDGITIQGIIKKSFIYDNKEYYNIWKIIISAPNNRRFRSIVYTTTYPSCFIHFDEGHHGLLSTIGSGSYDRWGHEEPLYRAYWYGNNEQLSSDDSSYISCTFHFELD